MEYTTYWSILDTPSHSIKSNLICLIIAIGAGLFWFLIKKFKNDKGEGEKTILLWAMGVFFVLGVTMYIILTFINKDNWDAQTLQQLDLSKTPKVEGIVSNFQRKVRNSRHGGETIESFTVDSVHFVYGDALLGRFNSFSKTYNNVIFNGQRVRITYSTTSPYSNNSNSILRIEIGR